MRDGCLCGVFPGRGVWGEEGLCLCVAYSTAAIDRDRQPADGHQRTPLNIFNTEL